MHIDHSKLIELLAEAAGATEQEIEEKLAKLIEEIHEAFAEGDAYEVNGVGVFSKMGSNVIFIPADDFATEINYKYVGMEPIELDEPSIDTEAPAVAEDISPQQDDAQDDEDEDPFGGLLDDDDAEEQSDEPEEALEEKEPEDITEFADKEAEESPFDIADEEPSEDAEEELTDPTQEEQPGPESWGIDTYKDDSAESMFSGLLGEKSGEEGFSLEDEGDSQKGEESLEEELEGALSDVEKEDDPDDDVFGALFSDDTKDKSSAKDVEKEEPEDPFEALAGEPEEEEDEKIAEEPEEKEKAEAKDRKPEEVVPVIKNLASESAKQKRKQEVQEKEEKSDKKEQPTPSFKRTATPRETKRQPVLLWVLLVIVILAGGTYGLGYLGVINIPGVTPKPQMTATQPSTKAEMQPAQPETQAAENEQPASEEPIQEEAESSSESTDSEPLSTPEVNDENVQEQATSPEVSSGREASSAGQPKYGLNGAVNRAANDGFTIVVFSLSNKESAESKIKELTAEGYRALLASVPSAQYGQLWRVSVGQFESTRTAALAADNLKAPYANNYFITRIY